MPIGLRSLLLLPFAALLVACGSPATPAPIPYNFNGNWSVRPNIGSEDMYLPVWNFGASLQVSNGVVTGSVVPDYLFAYGYPVGNPNHCPRVENISDLVWLPATGTLDNDNNLTISFPIAGGTGTLIATLADNPTTYAYGSWTIDGGSCAMATTPMAINQTYASTPSTTPTTPAPITSPLSGNWGISSVDLYPNDGLSRVSGFGGALQFSNGSVTGTLTPYIDYNGCSYYNNNAIPTFTGTLDADNNLTLTAPLTDGTATITATLGSNLQSLADGSYQVTGNECVTPATPMTIAQYAPLTGTYTGAFNILGDDMVPYPGTDITVTAVLTQSTTANSSGYYPLTGTINITGSCSDSFTISELVSGGNIGDNFEYPLFDTLLFGSFSPDASSVYAAYISSPKCGYYQGTLTRQ